MRAPTSPSASSPSRWLHRARSIRSARVDRTLRERIVAATAVELPVRRGQRLGEVRVYDGARLVAHSPLVAARAVAEPGLADRASWYARRTFSNLRP